MHRIMVATDGSRSAKRALDAAAKLAKKINSELIIITVGGTLSELDLKRLSRGKDTIANALKAISDKILDEACKRAKSIGARKIIRQSQTGDPAKTIIDAARRKQVDILIVGRHGFGPLTGWLFGNVSHKLTSLAPCAVMIIP